MARKAKRIEGNFSMVLNGEDVGFYIDTTLCPAEPENGIMGPYYETYEIRRLDGLPMSVADEATAIDSLA